MHLHLSAVREPALDSSELAVLSKTNAILAGDKVGLA